jgi:hypothetical protein
MLISPPTDVLECDADGSYYWLTVGDLIPLAIKAANGDKQVKEASVLRKIERWCVDDDVLGPYACKATPAQIAQLVEAGRIKNYPSKEKGVYLIHRDGLANIARRPKPGPRKKSK